MDVLTGECFASATDPLLLDQRAVEQNFDLVNAADLMEIKQFVSEQVWRPIPVDKCLRTPIDCVWVRKWKQLKQSDGSYKWIVKSRLCARGFLDSQGQNLSKRATTATRLSQRLLISLSAIYGFTVESWDVTGAFLKGLPFKDMYDILRKRGIKAPERQVYIQPPANVWRHLREIPDSGVKVPAGQFSSWALELLKAMYGLDDAPLAFQVVMQMFMTETLHGRPSAFDDCFCLWMKGPGELEAVATSYVDDNNNASTEPWLTKTYSRSSLKGLAALPNNVHR
jgi:hypothetical protein